MLPQGRIHVWSESAPAPPPFWQINHVNSAYFRLFLGYFRVISAIRPPLLDLGPLFLHILDPPLFFERNKNQAHLMHALQSKYCFITVSWFYLSFGCIFRTVLGMTIWRNVSFLIQSDPPTTNGTWRGAAQGRGWALVLLRWNFSLFCMSGLVLPPAPIPTYRLISKIGEKCLCYHLRLGLV